MERILRGCLLFAGTVLRVRAAWGHIALQEVAEPEHPFLAVDIGILDAEQRQFVLQPESEGTSQLVGAGPSISKGLQIDGIVGDPRGRIAAFVTSYKQISARTKRLVEFYVRGRTLEDHGFNEEAFLNFYKIYESFRNTLRKRFPIEDTKLRRIESDAQQRTERTNVIARLVGFSIAHNVEFQQALNQYELHRNEIVAHWNFREHDDGWCLSHSAVAVAHFLAHRIVLWEIGQELPPV
jgi:hypothetical protein